MGVGLVPRSFFLFLCFFGFVNQGQGCCKSSGTLRAGITTPAAAPTYPCGSLHSLEFSLQVRPKETCYGHPQHVGCSAGSQWTQHRVLQSDTFSSVLVTPTQIQARQRAQTVCLLTGAQVQSSLGSLPTNNASLYFKSGISCTMISYLVSEMSGMDLNQSKEPYHSGRGFGGIHCEQGCCKHGVIAVKTSLTCRKPRLE